MLERISSWGRGRQRGTKGPVIIYVEERERNRGTKAILN